MANQSTIRHQAVPRQLEMAQSWNRSELAEKQISFSKRPEFREKAAELAAGLERNGIISSFESVTTLF